MYISATCSNNTDQLVALVVGEPARRGQRMELVRVCQGLQLTSLFLIHMTVAQIPVQPHCCTPRRVILYGGQALHEIGKSTTRMSRGGHVAGELTKASCSG